MDFSPLIATHGTPVFNEFDFFKEKFGSEMITSGFWGERHFYPVKPSKYFSLPEIIYFGHMLEKLFSDENAWVEAQKYSYSMGSNADDVWNKLQDSRFRKAIE